MSLCVVAVDGGVVGADDGFPVGSALKEGQGLRHHALIKKKTKFSLYIGKLYMTKGFLIYEEMRKYLAKCEEAVRHI
jgi:hypothetical protein